MSDTTIMIDRETHETLKRLSELSHMPIKEIVAEWTREVQKVLDSFENPNRISFMSARHVNSKGPTNLVVTYLAELVMTSFPLEHSVSDKEALKRVNPK